MRRSAILAFLGGALFLGGCSNDSFSAADAAGPETGSSDASAGGDAAVPMVDAGDAGRICVRDCLGGACIQGACQPVAIVTIQDQPFDVVVDGAHLYWTNAGSAAANSVMSANLDGSVATALASDAKHPRTLAFDATSIYWVNDDSIMRATKGGGGTTTFVTGLTQPRGLALAGTWVFWTTTNPAFPQHLQRTSIVDGGVPDPDLLNGLTSAFGIAGDDLGIVVAQAGNISNHGALTFVTLDAATRGTPVVDQPSPIAVKIHGGNVYWANHGNGPQAPASPYPATGTNNGAIGMIARSGVGASIELASNQPYPVALAVDDTHVYYTTRGASAGDGSVMRVVLATSAVETLVTGQAKPSGIAVDATAIYWTTQGDGKVWRLAKP